MSQGWERPPQALSGWKLACQATGENNTAYNFLNLDSDSSFTYKHSKYLLPRFSYTLNFPETQPLDKTGEELYFLLFRTLSRVSHHIRKITWLMAMPVVVFELPTHLWLSVSVTVTLTVLLCIVKAPDTSMVFSGIFVVIRHLHIEMHTSLI